MAWETKFEKIDAYRWKIPKSYKVGMRVDGIIYATESMLSQIEKDKAIEQVVNVAHLPGIVKYSLAMPDIHWGYGFCLTKDARVLSRFGYTRPIEDFQEDWSKEAIKGVDFKNSQIISADILKFLILEPKKVYRVMTEAGYEIKATADHPFYAKAGMKPLDKLKLGEKIAVYPFVGTDYQRPSNQVIISEKDIEETLIKIGRKPNSRSFEIILRKLKKRSLLPLTYDHPKFPCILKIMGFLFGDGSMNFIGKRGDGVLHFAGKTEDLEEARKDLKNIGYIPGPIHNFKRKISKESIKVYDCYSFCVNASSLVVLLEALGVPRGRKVGQIYRIPEWIFQAPLWQKRLFLSALFGSELRMPHRRLGRRGYFNAPVFPMAKQENFLQNGFDFLKEISVLLADFGVKTSYINKRRRHISKKGNISWSLELIISPVPENLYNLWGKIGFEYNKKRSFLANVAVYYLRLKLKILKEKEDLIKERIPRLLKSGLSYQKIAAAIETGSLITKRFVVDICWKLNKGSEIVPRIPAEFPSLEKCTEKATLGLGKSGLVWDKVVKIEKIDYNDFVYDFTVSHTGHNFIADSFVVSNCIGGVAATDPDKDGVISPGGVGYDINCGVRLLKSKLNYNDVKEKVKEILNSLYNTVPAGVGSRGDIRITQKEERQLLLKGARWAVERGYGVKKDLEHCEECGEIKGADPGRVSERAYERGKSQAGTLGSGNHFLELQVIDEVYRKDLAEKLGLSLGAVTVMIHTGSRGFGYQICDDYLKTMLNAVRKYEINIPDRQLASAPINSNEGKDYIAAMKCAANYAWANRQCITHLVRETFEKVFGMSWESLGLDLIYDVAHNIAKFEKHILDGEEKLLCVHRKGATRAFPAGHADLPLAYKDIGQPVIIPGDMGRNSYLLVGTEKAMHDTFGSTCHGAGRVMSRSSAIKKGKGRSIISEMAMKGIVVMAKGKDTLLEEMSEAYKDINTVVDVVVGAGISDKICRMKPLGVIKG